MKFHLHRTEWNGIKSVFNGTDWTLSGANQFDKDNFGYDTADKARTQLCAAASVIPKMTVKKALRQIAIIEY